MRGRMNNAIPAFNLARDAMSEKKKMGRPTIFNQELADLICDRVATHTFGLKKLCELFPELPDRDTINQWRFKLPDFSAQYATAKMMQAELLAEEIPEIADDCTNDWMESLNDEEKGIGYKLNGEHVNRSRLRIDSRKWLASKLAPKIYGTLDKSDNTDKALSLAEQILKAKNGQK